MLFAHTTKFSSHCRRKATGYNRCAFTLLELLIVLVLIGLILALVGPRVGHLPGRLAREQLFSTFERAFRYARIRARATGNSVTLEINKSTNTIRMQTNTAASSTAYTTSDDMQNTSENDEAAESYPQTDTFELPEEVTWKSESTNNPLTYAFHPSGEAAGPSLRLEFRGATYSLRIDPFTGAPVITELEEHSF